MIVHVFNSSLVSGPETLVMPALAEIRDRAAVILLSEARKCEGSQKVRQYAESFGLQVIEITVRSRFDRRALRELARYLTRPEISMVHAHDVKASVYALKASQSNGTRQFKLVSTHHGVHARSGWLVSMYETYYVKRILPFYDATLTVCSSDRDLLIQRGLNPSKVIVHLNGVDRKRIDPAQRDAIRLEVQNRWGVSQLIRDAGADTCVIGVVARLSQEKRHLSILEVLRALKWRHPAYPWLLFCFGSGPLEKELQEYSLSLGLQHQVHWMGYRSGLADEMVGFDVLLSLSRGEGLPINVLEAGWAGTPVIATAIDGNRDVLTKECGLLVQVDESPERVADRIFEFTRDRKLLGEVGKKFLNRVETQFSGKIWLENLEKIYNEL